MSHVATIFFYLIGGVLWRIVVRFSNPTFHLLPRVYREWLAGSSVLDSPPPLGRAYKLASNQEEILHKIAVFLF